MSQTYEVWDIEPGRSLRVSVEGLVDDWEGFRVMLRDNETDQVIRISFDGYVAYQNRDESDLDGEAARSNGLGRGCFYVVQGSEFAARFSADSPRQFGELRHFAIITDMDCIDVLTSGEPTIQRL